MTDDEKIFLLESRVATMEREILSLRKASLLNFRAAVVASTGAIASLNGVKTESPQKLQSILDELNQLLNYGTDPEAGL